METAATVEFVEVIEEEVRNSITQLGVSMQIRTFTKGRLELREELERSTFDGHSRSLDREAF